MERLRTEVQKDNPSFDIIQGILEKAGASENDKVLPVVNGNSIPMTTKTTMGQFLLRKDNPSFGIVQRILEIEDQANNIPAPVQRYSDSLLIMMKKSRKELYNELEKDNPNFDIVQGIITKAAKNNHDFVTQVVDEKKKRYLLHYACWKNAPSDYVHSLIQHYPLAVRVQDKDGNYPLNYAISYNQCDLVIESLVQEYPQAVRAAQYPIRDRWYPIHFACEKNRSEYVIQLLLDSYPEAVQQQQHPYKCSYPLHIACRFHTSESVIRLLLNLYPRAVQQRSRDCKQYPFHIACESNQPLSVLQLLLGADPLAIKKIVRGGFYPLHLALDCTNQSVSVIRFLLKEYPEAIKEDATCDGTYPISIACKVTPTATNQSDAIIRLLIQEYPASVEFNCSMNKFPLHIACMYDQSDAVLKLLSFPQAASAKYHRTDIYPLHYACRVTRFKRSVDTIQLLIDHCPWAVQAKDDALQYPLHIACKSNQSEAVIQLLRQKYPEAQYQKDNDGFCPHDFFTKRQYNIYSWLLDKYCS